MSKPLSPMSANRNSTCKVRRYDSTKALHTSKAGWPHHVDVRDELPGVGHAVAELERADHAVVCAVRLAAVAVGLDRDDGQHRLPGLPGGKAEDG